MDFKKFASKWKRSIGYAILTVAISYALIVQNSNTNEIEKLGKANADQIVRNDIQDCLFTQNSRETVRSILSSIINQFPPGPGVDSIRTILEEEYPPIVCPSDEPPSPDGDPGTPPIVPGPTTIPETVAPLTVPPTVPPAIPETTVAP